MALALAALVPLLAGCSSPSLSSLTPSWFTSSSASNANASAGTLLSPDFDCPGVQVRAGASTLTSNANPADQTATSLRYQVTIGDTARECRTGSAPGTVSMRVGMQGRVIIGPEGGGVSTIDVPVRFAVVREVVDTKLITTRIDHITVSVPPQGGNVSFTHVAEGLEFPIPRGGDMDNYIVYIGFDAVSAEEKKPAPKRPQRPARTRQTG